MLTLLLSCLPSLYCLSFCWDRGFCPNLPRVRELFRDHNKKDLEGHLKWGLPPPLGGLAHIHEAPGLCSQCTRSPQADAKMRQAHRVVKIQPDKTPKHTFQGEGGTWPPPISSPGLHQACWDLHYVFYLSAPWCSSLKSRNWNNFDSYERIFFFNFKLLKQFSVFLIFLNHLLEQTIFCNIQSPIINIFVMMLRHFYIPLQAKSFVLAGVLFLLIFLII